MNSKTLDRGQKAIELIDRWVRARHHFEQIMKLPGGLRKRPWDDAAVERLNAAEAEMKRFSEHEGKAQ